MPPLPDLAQAGAAEHRRRHLEVGVTLLDCGRAHLQLQPVGLARLAGVEPPSLVPVKRHLFILEGIDDAKKAFIAGLDAGSVLINDSTDYRLDSMPFGGVKGSGLGKEGVKFSLQEMTEPKVVCFYHN